MYESFYQFSEKPFSLLPDPSFLYLSKQHATALTLLEYGLVNQAGFVVITGEIGCGKTTLIRHLLEGMDEDLSVGLLTNTHESLDELLQWVLMAFGLPHAGLDKAQRYEAFVNFVIEQYAQQKRTVLIVDEAQNLSVQALEELRMLSNVNADKYQVLQLILVGQPELLDTLGQASLYQFAQRVAVDYFIEPLNEKETADYIRSRLTTAGGSTRVFRKDALAAIHEYTGGVPRLINLMCDTALVYGFAAGRKTVNAAIIDEVVKDRSSGRRLWRRGGTKNHSSGAENSQDPASKLVLPKL